MPDDEYGPHRMVSTRLIENQIVAHETVRNDWLEILNVNPYHSEAAQMIVAINAKIAVLKQLLY